MRKILTMAMSAAMAAGLVFSVSAANAEILIKFSHVTKMLVIQKARLQAYLQSALTAKWQAV